MSRGALPGPLAWTLARRLLADPRSRLLHSSARAALLASTLGVAALGIALALMTGYREDLVRKLVGGNAAVLVDGRDLDPAADAELGAALAAIAGVERVDRVRYLEGVLATATGEAEVTLRAAPAGAGPLAPDAATSAPRPSGAWGIRLGARLAQELGVAPGERLRLTLLSLEGDRPSFRFRAFEFTGTFVSGFSEFDRGWAVVAPAAIADVPGAGRGVWEIALADPGVAPAVADAIRARFPATLVVPWQDLNRSLFAALDLQRRALFLLLGLIVVVATFNVASTLVVLVRERMRDLGVLASLGLAPPALRRVFLLYGGALGATGTALGLALAAAVSWSFTRFRVLSFGPDISEVYFLDAVPLRLAGSDALAIAVFSLAVTVAGCWLPAWRAARLEPGAALRYE